MKKNRKSPPVVFKVHHPFNRYKNRAEVKREEGGKRRKMTSAHYICS